MMPAFLDLIQVPAATEVLAPTMRGWEVRGRVLWTSQSEPACSLDPEGMLAMSLVS